MLSSAERVPQAKGRGLTAVLDVWGTRLKQLSARVLAMIPESGRRCRTPPSIVPPRCFGCHEVVTGAFGAQFSMLGGREAGVGWGWVGLGGGAREGS